MLARALTATVLVALTLTACGSNDPSQDAATAGTVTSASTTAAPTTSDPSNTPVLENTATTGAVDTPQGASTTEPSATAAAAGPVTTPGIAATPSSLQFNVPLVGGGQLDGSTLAGRPIALWFWAPT